LLLNLELSKSLELNKNLEQQAYVNYKCQFTKLILYKVLSAVVDYKCQFTNLE
jgi:hypothetical protein